MRVIALLAAYNEEKYIAQCLEHLFAQGVEAYLLDNESTDNTVAIAEQHQGRGLVGIETISRAHGHALREKLERKEELAATLEADWFIHMDPDEFRLPPTPTTTLAQAFAEAESQGYNAVNFLEFVFIPTQESPDHDHADFQKTMRWYYSFEPFYPHRLNAWKRQATRVDLASSAGHRVQFPDLKMYPVPFRMRHYHFLSLPQAVSKIVGRPYPQAEMEMGWHIWRSKVRPEMITLPSQAELTEYISDAELDPSHPRRIQYLGELVAAHEKSQAQPPASSHSSPNQQATSGSWKAEEVYQRLGMGNPYPGFDHLAYPLDLSGGRDHPIFKKLIDDIRPTRIIEVGSWKGKSAIHLAALLRERVLAGTILCVDTWLGTATQWLSASRPTWRLDSYRRHGYPVVYYQFLANVKRMGLQGYIVPLPNTSNIVAECLKQWQLQADLIYIDGSHEEADVYQDLVNYWRLLRPGGVLFGDDYWDVVGPGVINAVNRFARDTGQSFEVDDAKWVMRKPIHPGPEEDNFSGAISSPGNVETHANPVSQAQVAALETRIQSLAEQLKTAQTIAEVASREVNALHQAKFYRIASTYWRWRERFAHILALVLPRKPG